MHIAIVPNLAESSVAVEGPKNKVFQAFSRIEKSLGNLIYATDSVTDQFEACFRVFTPKEVVELFKSKSVYAGWNCANGELHVCGNRQHDVAIAKVLIKSLIHEASYPVVGELSPRQQNYIATGSRFHAFKAKLVKEHAASNLRMHYHQPSRKIRFALTLSGDVHAVTRSLDDFLFGPCNVPGKDAEVEAETVKLPLVVERDTSDERPACKSSRGRVAARTTCGYFGARDFSPTGSNVSSTDAVKLLGQEAQNRNSNYRDRGADRRGRFSYRGGHRQISSDITEASGFESANSDASHSTNASATASESSEDDQFSENEDTASYFKETRKIERHKLRFLVARHTLDQLKLKMHIAIVPNLAESSVAVEGPKNKVFQAFSKIEESLDNVICATDSVTDQFEACFRVFTAKEVAELFKSRGVNAWWNFANGELQVCGDTQDDVAIAMDLIKSLVHEASYPTEGELSPKQQNYVATGSRFYSLKAKLVKEHAASNLQLRYHQPSQKMRFVLKSSGDVSAVTQSLDDFFAPCSVLEESFEGEANAVQLLLVNKDYVLQQCSGGVTIDFDGMICSRSVRLRSNSVESLQNTKKRLIEMMNQKCNRSVCFEQPGDIAWLLSPMGESKIDDINKLCRSVFSMQNVRLRLTRKVGWSTTTYVPKAAARRSIDQGSSFSDTVGRPKSPSPPRSPPQAPPPKPSRISSFFSLFSKRQPQPPPPTPRTSFSAAPAAGIPLPSLTPTTKETLSKLEIVSRDICSVQAGGIVSSQGAIARSIQERGPIGFKLVAGIQSVRLQDGIQWNNVQVYQLHTDSWNGADSVQKLQKNIKKSFETLRQYQVGTMAFPAIGTGALNYPADVVAVTMINTLLQCLEETSDVSKVTIAVHPSAPHVYKVFKDQYTRHCSLAIVPLRVPVYAPSKRVTVTFTALRLADATEAEERLKKELSLHVTSVSWVSSPHRNAIEGLSQQELDTIYERATSSNVMVVFDLSGNNITLDGQKDDVTKLREEINQILHKKPLAAGGTTSLPFHWDQSALASGSYEVKLSSSSLEFRTVSAKFHKTCEKKFTISKIKRIRNEHLYTQYQAQKSKVLKDLGGDKSIEVERELWHGTSAESTKLICANEFNRSFAGKNGVAYGIGTYFSLTSNYSISYSSDRSYKYLILAKVATGRYKLGNSSTERKNLPQGYHSTVSQDICGVP